MSGVKGTNALTACKMAKRICDRSDNIYDKRIIENILKMSPQNRQQSRLPGRERNKPR